MIDIKGNYNKKRLVELLLDSEILCNDCGQSSSSYCAEAIADHLLAKGVIVPPCKVGEELYCVYSIPYPANPADKGKWFMGEFEVARFHYGVKGLSIELYGYGTVAEKEIGKTVFFTREEAEKALKERECV